MRVKRYSDNGYVETETLDIKPLFSEEVPFIGGEVVLSLEEYRQVLHTHQQLHQERERAEEYRRMYRQEVRDKDRAEQERDELRERFDNFVKDCGTTMYPCPQCGHGMSSRNGCLHCQRDEFRDALLNLLREAGPYAPQSKHLERECQDAQEVLERIGGDNAT